MCISVAGEIEKISIITEAKHCKGQLISETLAETIESGPLCITDLFQNKSVDYF